MQRHSAATPVWIVLLVPAALVLLLVVGCGRGERSPEEEIRLLVDEAEAAVEEKDLGRLRGYVAEGYADAAGNDRQSILGIVRLHFLRNEFIHLLVRISSIEVEEGGGARVVLYAAMAGEPFPDPDDLELFRADLYRFEFDLARDEEEGWQVAAASWRRAAPADFALGREE